jgi:hypothetical protein
MFGCSSNEDKQVGFCCRLESGDFTLVESWLPDDLAVRSLVKNDHVRSEQAANLHAVTSHPVRVMTSVCAFYPKALKSTDTATNVERKI